VFIKTLTFGLLVIQASRTQSGTPHSVGLLLVKWPTRPRNLYMTHTHTHTNTQHSQDTHIYAPGLIRTHNPSKRAAADPRLTPRGPLNESLHIRVTDYYKNYILVYNRLRVSRWRSCLRHYATSWKVAVSIPDSIIIIFHWRNPSSRSMNLRLTQPLTEMSTWNISWEVKTAGLTTLPFHVPFVLNSWSLNLLEASGPVQACNGIPLPSPFYNRLTTSSKHVTGLAVLSDVLSDFRDTKPHDCTATQWVNLYSAYYCIFLTHIATLLTGQHKAPTY
jgi:hypothetical protein